MNETIQTMLSLANSVRKRQPKSYFEAAALFADFIITHFESEEVKKREAVIEAAETFATKLSQVGLEAMRSSPELFALLDTTAELNR